MERRAFLRALLAVGASAPLASLPSNAPAAVVDQLWQQAIETPTEFAVDSYGTLWVPGVPEVEYRHQAFELVVRDGMTGAQIASLVEECPPLAEDLNDACLRALEDLAEAEQEPGRAQHRSLKRRISRAPASEAWRAWIDFLAAQKRLPELVEFIQAWLAQPLAVADYEHVSPYNGPQGEACRFFDTLPHKALTALGVRLVEGDHPGSSYFAAELTVGLDDANARVAKLGWPIRFVESSRW
ncbi:hypothetical protein [Roseateles sp. BYS87W]|uniref:Tat pathway signal protein n=1 Tax=Pelomonas baiyunensis TaxID=3299026 RepID=A0ABW7H2E2_9BURK